MSYQVLARKWRPRNFQEVVGQESVVQALVNGLDNDRVHHAFVLTGTRGVGKTTIARILAKCLNCEEGVSSTPCNRCSACLEVNEGRFQDMIEIDAASRTGVDDMRELLDTVQFMPTRGRFKVYIIDEVHMLSRSSFNALLKTLEEPPPHVKFVLATTDPQKIPVTILSRALRFNLRRLLPDQIAAQLRQLSRAENIEGEGAAFERLSRAADGSMRDALSLLDQAIAFGGGKVSDKDVVEMLGSVDHELIASMLDGLAAQDAAKLLELVQELASLSRDFETVLSDLAEALHRIGLLQMVPDYTDPERNDWEQLQALAGRLSPEDVQLFYQIAVQGRQDLRLAPNPRTGLEMALLRMLAFRPAEAPGSPAASPGGSDAKAPKQQARPLAGTAAAAPSATAAASRTTPSDTQRSAPAGDSGAVPAPVAGVSEEAAAPIADAERMDWKTLLEHLVLQGPVRELARNIQLDDREGPHWRFVIPDDVKYLGTKQLVSELQSALTAQIGEPVKLALTPARGTVASPAELEAQTQVRQLNDAERAIEDDPTVQSLKQQLGARILKDSIQPLQ